MSRKEVVEVFEFNELSDSAKKVAIEWYRRTMSQFDDFSDQINEDIEETLKTDLPWAPTEDIRFRLSYSQGDGVAFYGPVNVKAFVEKHPAFKGLTESEIQCELHIEKSGTLHLYDHAHTMVPEVRSVNCWNGCDYKKLELLALKAVEVIKDEIVEMSHKLYDYARKIDEHYSKDETIIENIVANEYEFTADGKRW